jgi:hypothetical protein
MIDFFSYPHFRIALVSSAAIGTSHNEKDREIMKPTNIEETVKCQQCNAEVKLTYIHRPGFSTTYSCDCPKRLFEKSG